MSYLLDKKIQRRKQATIFFIIAFFVLFYFRGSVFYGLSFASSTVFSPFLSLKNNTVVKFGEWSSYFNSKNSLTKEIEDLKLKLTDSEARMQNYSVLLDENENLKEILGRKNEGLTFILSVILGRSNQSPYDTLIIDAGNKEGVVVGAEVFAFGNIPIGRVDAVYADSSKVVLFSNSEERTSVYINDALFDLVGRGGGNFELILPRDFILEKGAHAVLPGIVPHVVATVVSTISDPRDSFKKVLLTSPINISELKFVQIEKN